MNDTDMTSRVNNIETEGPSARDDAGIVDAEITALKGAGQATVGNLSASITAMNRPLVSQQLVESIRAMTRPLVSQQLVESITAMNRPLVSQQLVESIRAMTRPLVSQQLVESITAMTRPLVSQQLVESITAMNRPLVSQQLVESIRTMNRPLVSQQLVESITAMNRPRFSQQLAETVGALNRPLFNTWYMESTVSLNLAPRVVTTREEHEIWSTSAVVEAEDYSLTEERSYWLTQFDTLVKDDGLRRSCRNLFSDGYYALAVERAYIYIDNLVSKRSGRSDKDGADLMRTVFSPKNPVLKLNNLQSRSEENQQQGYMHIFEGTMIGIRNPRAHVYDLEDSPEEALEMLVIASHLIRMLDRATSV